MPTSASQAITMHWLASMKRFSIAGESGYRVALRRRGGSWCGSGRFGLGGLCRRLSPCTVRYVDQRIRNLRSRMREIRTSGSVGAPGRQRLGATRLLTA